MVVRGIKVHTLCYYNSLPVTHLYLGINDHHYIPRAVFSTTLAMASKSVAVIVLSFVAVFVHQCSGRDKFDAIVEAGLGVEYSPPVPLFMINTVTQGMYVH